MPLSVDNQPRIALVTGGAKRVGRAIVERLVAAGYAVGFTYNGSAAEAEEITQRHPNTFATRADFSDPNASIAVAQWTKSTFSRLDVLVNCASMYVPDDGPIGGSPALQQKLFNINAVAPATLMAELGDALKASNGAIVNFVDLLAERPMPGYSAYCASKAALQSLTLSYARKLAPHVRVNGIAPGVIAWPDDMPVGAREQYLKRVPLQRSGTPQEAADLVFYLATAAPYITGQIIRLDGGRSIA